MPAGQSSTAANRLPLYVGDNISVGDIFQGASGKNYGGLRNVITGATTLTANQSGSLCLFNTAAGYTFTLPAASTALVGMWFEFLNTITNTSVACRIYTGSASIFIGGSPLTYINNTTPGANPGPKGFLFDSAASVAVSYGGTDTTAGGIAGTRIVLECVSSTLWIVSGQIIAAGTIVTSAAAS